MRIASIDVGSNTLRLLVAERGRDGAWTILHRESRIVRPSGNYDAGRKLLDAAAMDRTGATLADFAGKIGELGAGIVNAAATGIWRKGANARVCLERFRDETGLSVRVISGEEEAGFAMDGALFMLGAAAGPFVFLDIGGSSTELSICAGAAPDQRWLQSLDLGSVEMTERLVRHDPPAAAELRALEEEAGRGIAAGYDAMRGARRAVPGRLVGTAGTITTIAALLLELDPYDPRRVEGFDLERGATRDLLARVAAMPLAARRKLPGMPAGREDVIVAGAAIALAAMERGGHERLTVTEGSLLEGLLLAAAREP